MCDYGAPLHRDVNTRKLMQSTRDALVDAKMRGTLSRKNFVNLLHYRNIRNNNFFQKKINEIINIYFAPILLILLINF